MSVTGLRGATGAAGVTGAAGAAVLAGVSVAFCSVSVLGPGMRCG